MTMTMDNAAATAHTLYFFVDACHLDMYQHLLQKVSNLKVSSKIEDSMNGTIIHNNNNTHEEKTEKRDNGR